MDLDKVIIRSKVVKLIREFFDNQGFTEMLTPRLVGLPGQEPYLEPFWTEVTNNIPLVKGGKGGFSAALITSPEYSMKRLLARGMDKIYDLGSCFRNNEPWDGTHDPEFLMIEWYRRDSGVEQLMDDTEQMIRFVSEGCESEIQRSVYSAQRIFSAADIRGIPFRRMTVEQAWREYAGVELADYLGDREALAELAHTKFNQTVNDDDDWDDIYFKIFLSQIEPSLGWLQNNQDRVPRTVYPTFLHRYPASQASLSRKCADDPRWAERVELYIGDLELANGFAELCDADEQRKRFLEERALRSKQGRKTWALDERFLSDLPKMGNAAGIAFGVDRLVMLLTGSTSINDVLPFSASERFSP
ncbi:MAG: EF-P lysine aminoacylase EpmA [Patescibacteria group bacterium]|nr:EF-P lysine aminoacylase EpmA [Patescibacteria group bacterium]